MGMASLGILAAAQARSRRVCLCTASGACARFDGPTERCAGLTPFECPPTIISPARRLAGVAATEGMDDGKGREVTRGRRGTRESLLGELPETADRPSAAAVGRWRRPRLRLAAIGLLIALAAAFGVQRLAMNAQAATTGALT